MHNYISFSHSTLCRSSTRKDLQSQGSLKRCPTYLPTDRRVKTIGDLNGVGVVSLLQKLLKTPGKGDLGENETTGAPKEAVRHGVGGHVNRVEGTRETLVEEASGVGARGFRPLGVLVTSVASDHIEDIGTDIPTAESVQTPVGLDSGDLTVMVVEHGIGCVDKILGDGITKENAHDAITDGVGVVLTVSRQYTNIMESKD